MQPGSRRSAVTRPCVPLPRSTRIPSSADVIGPGGLGWCERTPGAFAEARPRWAGRALILLRGGVAAVHAPPPGTLPDRVDRQRFVTTRRRHGVAVAGCA